MSLQTSIHKLNSQLISLFAIVDGWCDRGNDFLDSYEKLNASPRETMVKFIGLNNHILNYLEQVLEQDALGIEVQPKTLLALVAETESNTTTIKDGHPDLFREMLREQLFHYLCLIDKFHNKRLDVSFSLVPPEVGRGLELIQSLTKQVTTSIVQQDKQFVLGLSG